jgi:YegS/Rv2252/BmrU family lipid kinase
MERFAMKKYYILYNPFAGNGKGEKAALKIHSKIQPKMDLPVEMIDMTEIEDYTEFFKSKGNAGIIICGGDGTLNRFINNTAEIDFKNKIYYCAIGTGNDFLRDLGIKNKTMPVEISSYIKNLPICEIDGKKYRFINGVGYGIDGYCCEVGDELKKKSKRKVNYSLIALKGLLYGYKPRNAVVTVDGVSHTFEKVWIAPVMNGRYYGGGIMAAPDQSRDSEDKTLSLTILRTKNKISALFYFPTLYKGKHTKLKDISTILTGKVITVEFDEPSALQIDGETHTNVSKYTAYTCDSVPYKENDKEAELV